MQKIKKEDSFIEQVSKLISMIQLSIPSVYGGYKNRKLWETINTYCLFLGYPRSGQVIGDKQGEGTTLRIQANSRYLQCLRQRINVPLKFIHITRNPYDNITTISKKTSNLDYDFSKSIEHYFFLCDTIAKFKETLDASEIYELKHELFLENPKFYLKEVCDFLGVWTTEDYLEDCANIVYPSPHKSRHSISWTPELISLIQAKINHYSFLSGYTYDS